MWDSPHHNLKKEESVPLFSWLSETQPAILGMSSIYVVSQPSACCIPSWSQWDCCHWSQGEQDWATNAGLRLTKQFSFSWGFNDSSLSFLNIHFSYTNPMTLNNSRESEQEGSELDSQGLAGTCKRMILEIWSKIQLTDIYFPRKM